MRTAGRRSTDETILTLCYQCSETYKEAPGMRAKGILLTKTEKKKCCENCRRKGGLAQYLVQSGRK